MPSTSPAPVDPVFAEITKAIYGDVDAREIAALAKFSPGSSDVHVDGPMTDKQAKRQKRIAQTGLGATGVAGVAGLHAVSASVGEHKHRMAEAKGETLPPKKKGLLVRLGEKAKIKPTRTAAVIGGGLLALHGVELGADALGIHAQTKALRQANASLPGKKKSVSKGFRLKPLNSVSNRIPSLRAKRPKLTPSPANPSTKAGLYQPVGKGLRDAWRSGEATLKHVQGVTANAEKTSAHAENVAHKIRDWVPGRKTAALIGTGTVGALSGATYAGLKAGSYAGTRAASPRQRKKKPVSKGAIKAWRSVKNVTENAGKTSEHVETTARKVRELIPTPRTAALIGGGTVAALSGATYAGLRAGTSAGTHAGPRRRTKKLNPVSKSDLDVTITKVDTDKRQVFGWASVSAINGQHIVDLQGDIVPIEEMEKSAYRYVVESRKGGDMHKRVAKADEPLHTADMIESFVVTPEKLEKMGLSADALPHGWWVGYHVNDDNQWAMVKSGERKGFSIHGAGRRTAVDKRARNRAPGRAKLNPLYTPQHTADEGVKAANKVRLKLHLYTPQVHTIGRWAPSLAAGSAGHLSHLIKADPVVKSLDDIRDKAAEKTRRVTTDLKRRADQAIHPPAVKTHRVHSSAIRSMGYQPQTRRLAIEMRSRPDRPYEYKTKADVAAAALTAPSKGYHYATQVRGKVKRAKGYSPADRARLFLKPQVSKAMPGGGEPRRGRLPGDNRNAEMARTRRNVGLSTAGVGYLVASRAGDVAPGAADWVTRSEKKIGHERHAAVTAQRTKRFSRLSVKGGTALVGAGLLAAGEGAFSDLRNRGSFHRTHQQVKQKVRQKLNKSAFGVEDGRKNNVAKGFDSEQSRHTRQDAYVGGAAGGAVVAGSGAAVAGRRAHRARKSARIEAANAAKSTDAVRNRLASMSQPVKTGGQARTAAHVTETARLQRHATERGKAALGYAGKARKLTRVSGALGLGAAALGGAAYGLHDYDRRRGGRSYGY